MKRFNQVLVAAFILSLSSISGYTQDYAFKVLVNKGNNQVKSGSTWQPVKVGAGLKSTDEVKIAENAYLGLVHVTGKPIEVKQAGNYKVSELAGKVKGGSSVLNKYTDFILSENTQKKSTLVATGAVHRGFDQIEVYLPKPESAVVYGKFVTINWGTKDIQGPYIVLLSSMFGDELQTIETADSTVQIDLYDKRFQNEDNIIIEVMAKDNPATKTVPALTLKKLSKADHERIKNSLNEVADPLDDDTALGKLYLATFFEKNHLLVDAVNAYMEAVRLAPDVVYYKDQYENFLIRNGIKEVKK